MGGGGCAIGKSLGHNQQLGGAQFVSDLRRSRFVPSYATAVALCTPFSFSLYLSLSNSPSLPPRSVRHLIPLLSLYIFLSLYIYISLSLSLSFSPVNDTEFRPKGSTAALFPEQGASSILIVLRSRVRSVLCRSKGETQNLSRMRMRVRVG